MKKIFVSTVCTSLFLVSSVHANPDGVVIGEGDLHITGGGSLVFSDGSIQSKAQVQGPQGEQGPQGPQGLPGLTGPAGPANVLTMGKITTGLAGSDASAEITGNAPYQTLNLTIPQGLTGNGVPNVQAFTTSGTFIVPANVNKIMVEMWGAGGSGGNSICDQNNFIYHTGGGGGSGGYVWNVLAVNPGDTYSITVGLGANNSNGGATLFGNLMTAGGGYSGTDYGIGGNGGPANGGILSIAGFMGYSAFLTSNSPNDIPMVGGNGAPSYRGGPGGQAGWVAFNAPHHYGSNGQAPGSGGGGGAPYAETPESTACSLGQGGKGANGIVLIYY